MRLNLQTTLSIRIRSAREARGLTQEKLAEAIGRSVETVSLIERGKVLPHLETLDELSSALQVPVHELLESPADGTAASRMRLETKIREVVRALSDEDAEIVLGQADVLRQVRGKRLR